MKYSKVRVCSLAMVVAMLCSCLAGCKGNEVTDSSVKEPVTIKVFSELSSYTGEQKGWGAKVLLDKFNIKLEYVYNGENAYEEGIESDDFADIIVFGGRNNYEDAVKNGHLYDWNRDSLISNYGKYIYDNMKDALNANSELTGEITGGERDTLYGIGHNIATSKNDTDADIYTWDIRWDLYKELGYPKVNNLDDLITVLDEMKKICPKDDNGDETYAASLWTDWDEDLLHNVSGLVSAYYGYDAFAMGFYEVETGAFHDVMEENGSYIKCLEFYNRLYQKGLLDPESSGQSYDEYHEKAVAGNIFWSVWNYSGSMLYNEHHTDDNKFMSSLVPTEASPVVYGLSTEGGNRIWTISADSKNPEICMKVINWLATPEGTMTYLYGPQSVCWDYDDEGYTYLTDFGRTAIYEKGTEMVNGYTGTYAEGFLQINNTVNIIYAENPDSNGESYRFEEWKSEQTAPLCNVEKDWREYVGAYSVADYFEKANRTVIPASDFELKEKDETLQTTWDSVASVIKDYSIKAIYAKSDAEFESIIDEMGKEADKAGYESCKSWAKAQAELRYKEENK